MIDFSKYPEILTLTELAELLRRHPSTIRKAILQNRFPDFPRPILVEPYRFLRDDVSKALKKTLDDQRRAYRRKRQKSRNR